MRRRYSKKLQGRGIFSYIGKKILGKAQTALQDKTKQLVEKKLHAIFSKKVKEPNNNEMSIQNKYGTGLKRY